MARIFIEGYEGNDYTQYDSPGLSAANSGGVGGSYCGSYQVQSMKTLSSSYAELWFSLYFKGNSSATNAIIKFRSASSVIGGLRRNNSTYLQAFLGDESSILQTGTTAVDWTVWNHVEIHYIPHPTSGVFQVKLNDSVSYDIDFSGGTTTAATVLDQFAANPSGNFYLDNVIVDDAEWIGQGYVVGMIPNGDASVSWRSTTGAANYTCVDERGPNSTDYNLVHDAGKLDLYDLSSVSSSLGTVKAVQPSLIINVTGNMPPAQKVRFVVKSGSTTYNSSDVSISGSLQMMSGPILANDPNTSLPWEVSAINALQAGVESRS